MLGQLINLNLFAFLLVFARMGAALSIMPGFGSQQIAMPIRLTFALIVALVVTPVVMDVLPAEPAAVSVLFMLLSSEILIGLFLGLVPRIYMAALQTAGAVLAMVASMANMFIQDPISEQQSSLFSTFLGLLGLTLIFVTNAHHMMLGALVDSYTLFAPVEGLMIGDMSDFLAHQVAGSFVLGVQLVSPLIVSGMAYYVGLGILGRLMPQLPVFFFGMPIQITLQLFLLMVSIPALAMVFMNRMDQGLYNFTAPLSH